MSAVLHEICCLRNGDVYLYVDSDSHAFPSLDSTPDDQFLLSSFDRSLLTANGDEQPIFVEGKALHFWQHSPGSPKGCVTNHNKMLFLAVENDQFVWRGEEPETDWECLHEQEPTSQRTAPPRRLKKRSKAVRVNKKTTRRVARKRVAKGADQALESAADQVVNRLISKSTALAEHCGRKTLKAKDVQLALTIGGRSLGV